MTLSDLPLAALHELATAHGIMLHYTDLDGRTYAAERHAVETMLGHLGIAADMMPPSKLSPDFVHVLRRDDDEQRTLSIAHTPAHGLHVRILCEDDERALTLACEQRGDDAWHITIPGTVPYGYHRLDLKWREDNDRKRRATQLLVLAPATSLPAQARLGERRGMGLGVDLYALRRQGDWGIGDFGTVAGLVELAATWGLDHVGLPPLHSIRAAGTDISPYSPVSRIFLNALYVDPTAVPEWQTSTVAQAWFAETNVQSALRAAREAALVDYDEVRALKEQALALVWHEFRDRAAPPRRQAFERFCLEQGDELTRYATFVALDAHLRARGHEGPSTWPATYRAARGAAVRRFAQRHHDVIDMHRWVQFEADRQLGAAAAAARERLRLGLYLDLAIGSSASGYDLWAHPELYLGEVAAGSPPDYFNPLGQNWGLPPLSPRALRTSRGCRYFASLVRANLRHAGTLRIDHAAALHRLFVIPRTLSAKQGLYVHMPEEILTAVLAIESHRHQTVIIGEDLGNVPDHVRALLHREQALGYRVLLFEQRFDHHGHGHFPASRAWPAQVLATATTHDTPTLRAWVEGGDIAERVTLALLSAHDEPHARQGRQRDLDALTRALRHEGLLPVERAHPLYPDLARAIHQFLARTPALVMELRLANLGAGETTPVNVPGVGPERYPAWRPKMSTPLETWMQDEQLCAQVRALVSSRGA